MRQKVRTFHAGNGGARRAGVRPNGPGPDNWRLGRALGAVVAEVGGRLERAVTAVWEGQSADGSHLCSRNDLEATGGVFQSVFEVFPREGLKLDVDFLMEEACLVPAQFCNGRRVHLVIDPIDGTKAFDNWKWGGDCPVPRPGSAVSIAAVCPILGVSLATAVYCLDLREVFSSIYLGTNGDGQAEYAAFRNSSVLHPIPLMGHGAPEARRRVLCGNYNSRALEDIARLELALMQKGLKGAYGGLTGSSATDIINVVRGSFCACVDVRALCGKGGSVPYWYDAAGALPVAAGRGLRVLVTDAQGAPLAGANHAIFTPVAFIVARPEVVDTVIEAIRATICPGFGRSETVRAAEVMGAPVA
jgi:fructose-1,6-bisphosphatase/inositol monophosphatase family enzyme